MPHRPHLLGTACLVLSLCLRLPAQDAALDPTFNPTDPGFSVGDGTNADIKCMGLQSDDKVLIGGEFATYNGTPKTWLARLLPNGTLDTTYPNGSGPNGAVNELEVLSSGKVLIAGSFTTVNGTACGRIARLNADGSLDNTFNPGTGAGENSITLMRLHADGKILLRGTFFTFNGLNKPGFVRLNANGSVDAPFPQTTGDFLGGLVSDMRTQADGRIIAVGTFTEYDGTFRRRVARLNNDGSLDLSFDPLNGPNTAVNAAAVLPDGRILIGGSFSSYNGTGANRIARLGSTGTLDATFTGLSGFVLTPTAVNGIQVLGDGRIYVASSGFWNQDFNTLHFTRLAANGGVDPAFTPEYAISTSIGVTDMVVRPDGRLVVNCGIQGLSVRGPSQFLASGGLDMTFNPGSGIGEQVYAIVHQPDGKAIIGGSFVGYNGALHKRLVRIDASGNADPSFSAGIGPNTDIRALALQPDGKVLIGGLFATYNGTTRHRLARLNSDGTLDPTFTLGPNSSGARVNAIAVMPDGRIVIAGDFNLVSSIPRKYVARFLSNGTLDTAFDPGSGPNGAITALAVQPDGKVLISGNFTMIGSTARARIARLNADGTLDTTFDPGSGMGVGSNVTSFLLPGDGRILVAGSFSSYNGNSCGNIARLTALGAFDPTFTAGAGFFAGVASCGQQPDGRLLFGGGFFDYQGVQRERVARLELNAALDNTFVPTPGANAHVTAHSLAPDGSILIGGLFTAYNGTGRKRLALIRGTRRVAVKVLLDGPYTGSTMTDALRTLPSFPLTEPYTALGYSHPTFIPGNTILPGVLTVTGNDAIVDWVLVEMRPSASPGTIAAARAVLLQRDGDVVDLDGRSTIGFAGLVDGSYCVAVRHRNHLPVMLSSSTPISYGSGVPVVDFTQPATQVSDADARKNVGGIMVLAAGDVTWSQEVKYTGSGNDRDPILLRVGSTTPNNSVSGYWREDVNMDGVVKYTGSANDRDPILVNVGSTTPNNTRVATVP